MSKTSSRLGGARTAQPVPRYEHAKEGPPIHRLPGQDGEAALESAIGQHAREAERYRAPLVRLPPPTW